jgi:hypothetical protein
LSNFIKTYPYRFVVVGIRLFHTIPGFQVPAYTVTLQGIGTGPALAGRTGIGLGKDWQNHEQQQYTENQGARPHATTMPWEGLFCNPSRSVAIPEKTCLAPSARKGRTILAFIRDTPGEIAGTGEKNRAGWPEET